MTAPDSDSLDFNLKQLRALEQERLEDARRAALRQQEDQRRAAIEAQLADQARGKHEQSAVLERLREDELRRRRATEEQEAQLEAAERQARAEAEQRLLAHRNAIHADALREQRAHRWQALLGVILTLVMLTSAGLAYAIYRSKGEIARAERTRLGQQRLFRALQAELEEAQARAKRAARRAQREVTAYNKLIAEAKTEAQRRLLLEHQQAMAEAALAAGKRAFRARAASARAAKKLTETKCDPDDPICFR